MELTKKNYVALDIGKFLSALLILFYHYFSEHPGLPSIIDEALSLYAVAVALFMLISGFLTFNKLQNIETQTERWAVVKKQVFRILKVYLLWSIVYIIYTVLRWDFATITLNDILWSVQGWIFKSTFYTIWFMPALAIGLVLAFWFTERLPKWLCVVLGVVLYAFGAIMLTYSFIGNMIPGFEKITVFCNNWLGGARGWLFFACPLLMLGKVAANVKDKFKWQRMLLYAVVCVGGVLAEALILRKFVGHTGIDMTIMMVPAVFFILAFLVSVKIPCGSYAVWMRKMSVLIFMTQRIFLTVIPSLLSDGIKSMLFSNIYVGAIFICGGTILFSAIIIALSDKIKWFKNLY